MSPPPFSLKAQKSQSLELSQLIVIKLQFVVPLKATFLTSMSAKRMQPVLYSKIIHSYLCITGTSHLKTFKNTSGIFGILGLLPRPALVHLAQGQTFAAL